MARKRLVEPTVKPLTLEQELENVEDGYSSCDHERDIRSEVVSEVRSLLRNRGLLDALAPTAADGKCSFCSSTDLVLVHKRYCIHD